MAEGLGFEPRKELPLCRFSRPVLSTAQPSFQRFQSVQNVYNTMLLNQIYFFYSNICATSVPQLILNLTGSHDRLIVLYKLDGLFTLKKSN